MTGASRPTVAIVTTDWADDANERAAVVRLFAGALSRSARVEIVHLSATTTEYERTVDSVFALHRVPLKGADPLLAAVLRGSLAALGRGATAPSAILDQLDQLVGRAPDLATVLSSVAADAVVLAGLPLPVDERSLEAIGHARLVVCPMLSDRSDLASESVSRLLDAADAVGSLHPGEHRALLGAVRGAETVVSPLDIALSLNRSATEQGLFGVGWFGRYVLAIRRFPATGPRFERSVTHELLRSALGPVAVAEVDGTRWRVTDVENTAELPVNPTRVNLWRLFAHAEFTVDLRPPSPFGREAIESMLFGAPPIVPEHSAAHAHVEAANGGLWYSNAGELLDLAVVMLDDERLRAGLATSGRAYAVEHHEQMDDFVERCAELVLGSSVPSGATLAQ